MVFLSSFVIYFGSSAASYAGNEAIFWGPAPWERSSFTGLTFVPSMLYSRWFQILTQIKFFDRIFPTGARFS